VWAHCVFAIAAIPMTLVDVKHHRLPDVYTLGVWGLTAAGVIPLLADPRVGTQARQAVIASALAVLALWLLAEAPGRPLGFGDVKLGGLIGMQLGFYGVEGMWGGLALAFVLGGLWAIWLVASGQLHPHQHLAFGPFLLSGTLIQLVLVGSVENGAKNHLTQGELASTLVDCVFVGTPVVGAQKLGPTRYRVTNDTTGQSKTSSQERSRQPPRHTVWHLTG
jgi:leader peptidase (prepilin peptidase)/N-methyltransferase